MKARNLTLTLFGILLIGFISISVTTPRDYEMEFIEESIEIEEWMTRPFQSDSVYFFAEEPIELEDWMTQPFDTV